MNRGVRFLALFGLLGAAWTAHASAPLFDFEMLQHRAKLLAEAPYTPPPTVPEWLQRLSYDQHRLIQFNAARTLWRRDNLPFQVQFFHPGYIFNHGVQVYELHRRRAVPIEFNRDFFRYDHLKLGPLPSAMGFAGVRFLYPLNHPADELGVFLGASYFRFLCQHAFYGLSARGIAINTGTNVPEEFPMFTSFWLQRPAPGDKTLTVYALLDGKSVTGAYRFLITPGADTVMQVRTAIYFRQTPGVVGVAPLTSMFWHGENSHRAAAGDFRPEVHDSDGLQIETGAGEWLWRPLTNPAAPLTSVFSDVNPRGFGLMQRDRDFEHYQDLEAKYQLRPSAWVEPVGTWGAGAVRLVELPTANEFDDNIVAFWVPAKLPAPGQPLNLEYRLHWCLDQIHPPAGYVVATRHGHDVAYHQDERFLVDFSGEYLSHQPADPKIEPVVSIGQGGRVADVSLQKNPYNGSWRVSFIVKPDGSGRPVELRCFLRKPPHVLTETWSYLWQP